MLDAAVLDVFIYLKNNYANEIGRSVTLITLLVVVRFVIGRLLMASCRVSVDDRRRWSVNTRNVLVVTGLLGIGLIWANELQSIAVSMLAVTAALVLATKELIMCVSGGLLRKITNSYTLSDHIEVGVVRGRVVDIGLLTTTVLEIGPHHSSHQITGRALSFPNSLLLSLPVIRENYMGEYVMHIITIPVPYTVSPVMAERTLMVAAKKVCQKYIEPARAYMEDMAKRYMLDAPSVEPRISLQPVDDKRYDLGLRVAIPARKRQRIEQAILYQFMWKCFPETGLTPVAGNS